MQVTTIGDCQLAATWSETGRVHIWDLTTPLTKVDGTQASLSSQSAVFTFAGHQSEGYAVDWSTIDKGCSLLTLVQFINDLIIVVIFWRGRAWLKDQVIQFWWRSGSRFGSGSPKSEIQILQIGGGLCSECISCYSYKCLCLIIVICLGRDADLHMHS